MEGIFLCALRTMVFSKIDMMFPFTPKQLPWPEPSTRGEHCSLHVFQMFAQQGMAGTIHLYSIVLPDLVW